MTDTVSSAESGLFAIWSFTAGDSHPLFSLEIALLNTCGDTDGRHFSPFHGGFVFLSLQPETSMTCWPLGPNPPGRSPFLFAN